MTEEWQNTKVRAPIASGLLYPERGEDLSRAVDLLLAGKTRGNATAILAPHASLDYSGEVSAAAWAAAALSAPDLVVLLGPCHSRTEPRVYLPESGRFSTPIGPVRIDLRTVAEIASNSTAFVTDDVPHLEEHSIEMQLPFVARLFPDVPVLPALFGCKDGSLALGAARLLSASTADRRVLFVGSTEYQFLPTNPATRARAQAAIAASVSVDLAELEREAGSEAGCSCGAAAALALAAIARGSNAAGALLSVSESPDEPSSGAGISVMYAAVAYRVAEG